MECKTVGAYNADKWKDGNIPLHYVLQWVHYMAVTGLVAAEEDFWKNHVEKAYCRLRIKEGSVLPALWRLYLQHEN